MWFEVMEQRRAEEEQLSWARLGRPWNAKVRAQPWSCSSNGNLGSWGRGRRASELSCRG